MQFFISSQRLYLMVFKIANNEQCYDDILEVMFTFIQWFSPNLFIDGRKQNERIVNESEKCHNNRLDLIVMIRLVQIVLQIENLRIYLYFQNAKALRSKIYIKLEHKYYNLVSMIYKFMHLPDVQIKPQSTSNIADDFESINNLSVQNIIFNSLLILNFSAFHVFINKFFGNHPFLNTNFEEFSLKSTAIYTFLNQYRTKTNIHVEINYYDRSSVWTMRSCRVKPMRYDELSERVFVFVNLQIISISKYINRWLLFIIFVLFYEYVYSISIFSNRILDNCLLYMHYLTSIILCVIYCVLIYEKKCVIKTVSLGSSRIFNTYQMITNCPNGFEKQYKFM